MSVIIELFTAFLKIGLFSFGGGYAIIPFLQSEAVNRSWLTVAEFLDIVAVSQVTPGPIAVNMATFVGYRQYGIAGSFAATFGVCLPSLVLVIIASYFIAKVNKSKIVKGAFYGLRPAACGLIGASAINILWSELLPGIEKLNFTGFFSNISIFALIIFAVAFVCMFKLKVNPIFVIIGAAVVGILYGQSGLTI